MLCMCEEHLKRMLAAERQKGMDLMKDKIVASCENGTPLEVKGRAYFIKSDKENLRDIFADLESND